MTDLDQLQRDASRYDYRSMARFARALYEHGGTVRSVLRTCYGVDFPEELFLIAEARNNHRAPFGTFMNQPWRLAVPLEQGGPPPDPHGLEYLEQRAWNVDSQLVPLVDLADSENVHGNSLLCYRLDELAQGRSTVIGLRDITFRDAVIIPERYGVSLVTVLHEHYSQALRRLQNEFDSPYNRGAGSIDETYVSDARAALEPVEEIRRALAGGEMAFK